MRGEDSARRARLSCPSMKALSTHPRIKTFCRRSWCRPRKGGFKTKRKGGNSSKTRRLATRQSPPQTGRSNGVKVVEGWPIKGDAINPIENLWAILDERLDDKKFKTEKGMKRAIRQVWDQVICPSYTTLFTPFQTVCGELGRSKEAL